MFARGFPPAPLAPLALGGMLGGDPPGHSSFGTYYVDDIMNDFSVNCTPPQHLRHHIVNSDPRNSATGYRFLVEAPGNPAHPGFLVTHHTVTRYTRKVGHGPTPWDDNVFSLSGDIINGSLSTIYQFPDNAFKLVNMGNTFYVRMYQRAIAQFNADPAAQLLGPFGAHDVGT
jgi:hypothetical protein